MAKAKKRYVRNVIEERKRNLLLPEGLEAYRENPLGWYTSPLMRESFAPGSKRSDRKGHGTGVKDYTSLEEMSKLPLRGSLAPGRKGPQNTYRTISGSGGIPVTYVSGVSDDRTEEERAAQEAWDERMAEINKGRDDRLKARKKERIRRAQETAWGEPTKWAEPSREPTPPTAQEQEQGQEQGQNQSAVNNGTRQRHDAGKKEKKGTEGAQGQPPPKGANVSMGRTSYGSTPGESGVVVDGAPVAANNTAARDNIAAAQRESTRVNKINAEQARKDAQSRAYDADRRREAQEIRARVARGEERERYYAKREAARRAAAEQAYRERMDQRYKEGKLSSVDDWKNLGREGSNRRNYSAVENETEAQKAEREKAVADRNDRIKALSLRAAKMADKTLLKDGETLSWTDDGKRVVKNANGDVVGDADLDSRKIKGVGNEGYSYAKGSFYSNNPAKMRGLENLRKVYEKGIADGTLTDKQIDAFEAKLDSWDAEAKSIRRRIDAAIAEHEMRQQLELRQKYGMTDKDPGTGQYLVSDDELKDYDKKVRGEIVKKTLGEMATRGPVDTEQGYREYGKSWQTLMENGINMPQARADAFKALSPEARAEYNRQVHEAASEDERDTVKQNLVLNYLYKKNGITRDDPTMGTVVGHDVARLNSQAIAEHNDRPGNVSEIAEPVSMQDLPGGQMAVLAPRSAAPEKLPPTVPDVAGAEPVKPKAVAPVAPTAAPAAAEGQSLADMTRKKKEENQTAYRGGFAAPLRPRHFRG